MRQSMTSVDKLHALEAVPQLARLARPELEALAARAEEQIAAPGDVLARESQCQGQTFLLLSGEAMVERGGAIVTTATEGDLVDAADLQATITAVTLMHLLVFH